MKKNIFFGGAFGSSNGGGGLTPSQNALLQTVLNKQDISGKGQINGYASLDGTGKVPTSQLPSYVDDVLEYANFSSFPITGETGKIYIALDTNFTYRWSGSIYVKINDVDLTNYFNKTTDTATQISYNNTTSGLLSNNLQGTTDELTARLQTVENRSIGSGNAGEKYYISTPTTGGIYKASKDFTTINPATISLTLTTTYQNIFEAETDPLNTTLLQNGDWNFDFDFTHTTDKEFDIKVSFYDGTTLLDSIEQTILAGLEKIVLQKSFNSFAFTQNNKLKFKVELKSPHTQTINFFTNDQVKNLHIHTPIVIDIVNSPVQTALNLKQDITDNTLNTTSKTIVGAINEVRDRANHTGTQQASTVAQTTITPLNATLVNNDTQETINNKLQGQINFKSNDNAVVHLTGAETITGNKTFGGTVNLSNLTASQKIELDANNNIISVAKNVINLTSTTTSTTPLNLTNSSVYTQILTGTVAQIIRLPNATTLNIGHTFEFVNNSTQMVSIFANDTTTQITTILANAVVRIQNSANATTNGIWNVVFIQGEIPDANNINQPVSTLVSAATVNLNSATSDVVEITGTTTITAFTLTNGIKKTLRFTGALQLTHNATTLILTTSANITTSTGDTCVVVGTANGVRMVSYQRANGTSLSNSGLVLHTVNAINQASAPSILSVNNQFTSNNGFNYLSNSNFGTINSNGTTTNITNTDALKGFGTTQTGALQYFPNWFVTTNDATSRVSLSQAKFLGRQYARFQATIGGNGEAFNQRIVGCLKELSGKNMMISFPMRLFDAVIGNRYQCRVAFSPDGTLAPLSLGSFRIIVANANANLQGTNNANLLFTTDVSLVANSSTEDIIKRTFTMPSFVIGTLSTPPTSPTTNDAYEVGTAPTGAWAGFVVGTIALWNGTSWANYTNGLSNGFIQIEISKFDGTDVCDFAIGEGIKFEQGLVATNPQNKPQILQNLENTLQATGKISDDYITPIDLRQESTLFVEKTYGLDTNAGTTPNKPFKTIAKAWTDINSSGQIKVTGSATYNETHTFSETKTSIKTTLDKGAKITGTIELVNGNTSMYFNSGMFEATLNDNSSGTTYFENVNVGGATFNFSNGGYKVIKGSSSSPLKINLTGNAGILFLENISGGNISIDIGIGWVVFINGVQLNIGVRLGTVIEGLLVSNIISSQPALDQLVAINNANGYYVVNFGNEATPPLIKDNTGQTIKILQPGDVIYKVGLNHELVYTMQSAPSTLNLLTGANQTTTLLKNNTQWVTFNNINTNITNIQAQVNGRSNIIVVSTEAERKALVFGTGFEQVGNGTLVLQKNGGGATPFVFNGGNSQDITANANWITANTNAIPAIKPTARIWIVSGQSNTSGYAILNTDYLDDSPNASDNVDVMPSRCLLSNSAEDTGLFYTTNVTANGTNRVIITNTNFIYKFKKRQRVYGTNVPANTYVTDPDVNNDFTTIQFNNIIPNTVTSINFSNLEGEPIKLQAFNNSGKRTMPAYRIGNANGSGVAYYFAKGNIDQNFQENSNDVFCIICAINGSTGFANNGAWVANTGYLAKESIELYARAKEYYEAQDFNVTLSGGMFCLGEEDSRQGTTTTAMQTFLQNLVDYYKNNCLPTLNFSTKAPIWLFNGLHSYWLNSTLGYGRAEIIPLNQKVAVDNAFRNMSQLVEGATYVAFPTQNKDYTQADPIHVTVPATKRQAKRLINALQKAKQNTVDSPSEAPENFAVNGIQETGALATWDALFQQKYDLEWKFSNEDWDVATRVNDLTSASYSVPADSGTTIDVRVRAKKQNGAGISAWTTVIGTTLASTIQNQMTVRFTAGINSDDNFVLTNFLGNLNETLQTGAQHISKWLNEVSGQRHAESLIMGTSGYTTTITLTAGSNIAVLGNATGVTASTINKTYVDIVSTIVGNIKHSDYSILPRNTLITAVNGTQITMSSPAPATVDVGGYNVRLRYNRTLTQAGGALTQTGGNRQGHPVRSKILNNNNQWLHCLNLQSENNGLIVDDLLDGNFSYSGTVLFRHTAYNTLVAVANSNLTSIANTTAYGGNVAIDTGSRNYLSRIIEQSLAKLSTLWRTGGFRVVVNHNTISGGATDTSDILQDKWYMFTVTFDRVAGLIKLYRNGTFVAQFTNTSALTAFQGYIGCIELSNGFRAGSVGANIAAVYYHKRELAPTEITSLRTFLTNKFNVTLG